VCNRARERAAAEATIREHGLGDDVTRIGWDAYVPPADMPPHYRWADVGLALFEPHPNFVGSMPTKFYEYMHHGLPIIAADVPLWRRFLRAHDCGVVVPPGDAEAVRDVLSRCRSGPVPRPRPQRPGGRVRVPVGADGGSARAPLPRAPGVRSRGRGLKAGAYRMTVTFSTSPWKV
jgi:glycosyltransferase involved in cell wall biosynthesis